MRFVTKSLSDMDKLYSKYTNYTVEQFLTDNYFQEWIISPTSVSNAFWQNFKETLKHKTKNIEIAENILKSINFNECWPAEDRVESILQQTLFKINHTDPIAISRNIAPSRRISGKKIWMAAASVLVLLLGAYYITNNYIQKSNNPLNKTITAKKTAVKPGSNKAILTLANGAVVDLDSATDGNIAKQGNVIINKQNGEIIYTSSNGGSLAQYNVISTPKGGKYQVSLSDGTKVWLNAASSIRFPTSFNEKERKVEITGEVYLEVTHNKEKPFIVQNAGVLIKVLGTHFNVNTYNDKGALEVTLLEGSINVSEPSQQLAKMIKPGEQALIYKNKIDINTSPAMEEIMAWKNDQFILHDANIELLMNQIERWYDVDVIYSKKITNVKLGLIISRNATLPSILSILEVYGIKATLIGNKKVIIQ